MAGMKWLPGTYPARLNRRHKLSGHLFAGRYESLVVDAASPGYLRTLGEYVHLNPVRAGLLRPEEPLRGNRWSSIRRVSSGQAGVHRVVFRRAGEPLVERYTEARHGENHPRVLQILDHAPGLRDGGEAESFGQCLQG